MGTLHEDLRTFIIISRRILLRIRGISDKLVQNIKIHILGSVIFFESRAVYDIIRKIMIEPDKPQMTI